MSSLKSMMPGSPGNPVTMGAPGIEVPPINPGMLPGSGGGFLDALRKMQTQAQAIPPTATGAAGSDDQYSAGPNLPMMPAILARLGPPSAAFPFGAPGRSRYGRGGYRA